MEALLFEIKNFLTERAWNKLRPGDLAKSISIEAAELLELFQWHNPELDEVKNDLELIAALKKELADVLICAFETAVLLDLDVEKIVREKLSAAKKKYPAEAMKNDVDPARSDSRYLAIKRAYRGNNAE